METNLKEIENLVESSVSLSQNDWDSYKTSWDSLSVIR